jgi:hypothetical protein
MKLAGLGQQLTQLTGISSFETDADNLIQQALTIYEQREVNWLLDSILEPKKCLAIATVVQAVTSKMEAYGVPVPTKWEPRLELKMLKARDYYSQQLIYDDFSMLKTAIQIGDLFGTLTGDAGESESNRKYLAGIMTFTLTMDLVWTFSHGKMEAQGDVTIMADPQTFALTGSGSIANNSGNFDSCNFVQNPFDETVGVKDWDMQCKGSTVNLTVSPLALTSAILTCPSVAPFTYPVSPLQDAAGIAFAGYGGGSGLIFNASVSTGSSTPVDQTFTGDSGSGPVTLHLTLKHTPKFGVGL